MADASSFAGPDSESPSIAASQAAPPLASRFSLPPLTIQAIHQGYTSAASSLARTGQSRRRPSACGDPLDSSEMDGSPDPRPRLVCSLRSRALGC